MLDNLFKDKKKVGIFIILIIIIAILGFNYTRQGFKELKKNNTETIFVESDSEDSTKIDNANVNKEKDVQLKKKEIIVEIKGEVKKPDVYTLEEEAIVKELIDLAGGLTDEADISKINRAKKLQNHELIYIGNKSDKNENIGEGTVVNDSSADGKININSATLEQLKELNGVGDSKAKGIIEYREKNGGFKSIDDLKNVDGIGEKMFEKMKDNVEI